MSFPYRPGFAEVEVTIRLTYACDQGETCGTCKWSASYVRYAKCRHPLRKFKNTHGKATDIRLRSPACSKWEKETRE